MQLIMQTKVQDHKSVRNVHIQENDKLYLGNPSFKLCRDYMQLIIQTKVQDHKSVTNVHIPESIGNSYFIAGFVLLRH